jgi:hypothetical protein
MRNDSRGAHFSVQQRLEGFQDRSIGGLGKQAQQAALALEQAAQNAGNAKRPVAVRDRGKDIVSQFFGKENGAFGLAAGAKNPGPAGECQQMFRMTLA